MTSSIPAGFTQYDWLQLVAFDSKVTREGYAYAAEHYAPQFETPALEAVAADPHQMKFLYDRQRAAIDTWWDTHGEVAADLLNTHIEEEQRRRKDASLWGIRCTDGHIITCDSQTHRDGLVAVMCAEKPRPGRRVPAARLRRLAAGGEWHESALPT